MVEGELKTEVSHVLIESIIDTVLVNHIPDSTEQGPVALLHGPFAWIVKSS